MLWLLVKTTFLLLTFTMLCANSADKQLIFFFFFFFFRKNISIYAVFNDQSFNNTLANNIVSFEQLGQTR